MSDESSFDDLDAFIAERDARSPGFAARVDAALAARRAARKRKGPVWASEQQANPKQADPPPDGCDG